MLNKFIC